MALVISNKKAWCSMMEKNENANKRQDFAEGIIDPETAKAAAGGNTPKYPKSTVKTHYGKQCSNCGQPDYKTDFIEIAGKKHLRTLCCNHIF